MARSLKDLAAKLSVDELKHLLAVKEKLAALEKRRAGLEKELAKVEAQIAKLVAGAPKKRRAKKVTRKKATSAKAKTAKKTVRKAKARKKASPRKKTSGKPTVEAVVAAMVRKHGAPMTFQEILGTITKKKLVKTKSKNFANVLRRTLSTSKQLKRVGRGVYGLS
ncbi:hypothetical protein H8E07_01140 [bacterium]|nr:hypothetical protein [bacterium]